MSKKKMYLLLGFIIATFMLLGVAIILEFNLYRDRTDSQNEAVITGNLRDQTQGSPDALSELDKEDSFYEENPAATPTEEIKEWEDIVMLFSGDIYLSDYVLDGYNKNGIDGILSKALQEEFTQADIAMVNQEFAFTNRGTKMQDKQYTFRVDPKNIQIFKDMGIDIVSLANNHTMDYGIDGLTDSFDTLNNAGIEYVGAGNNITEAREIKYREVNDKTLAFLGASRVIPVPDWNATNTKAGMLTTYDPTLLIEDIEIAKTKSDFVVVYVHWGIEKEEQPLSYQRSMGKQYIDAGADLVIGSHPHVLQGIEYYNGKPIIYSLGNFMFYNTINQTAVLKVTLNEQNEVKIQLLPGKAQGALTTLLEEHSLKSKFYQYMTQISFDITFDENGTILP